MTQNVLRDSKKRTETSPKDITSPCGFSLSDSNRMCLNQCGACPSSCIVHPRTFKKLSWPAKNNVTIVSRMSSSESPLEKRVEIKSAGESSPSEAMRVSCCCRRFTITDSATAHRCDRAASKRRLVPVIWVDSEYTSSYMQAHWKITEPKCTLSVNVQTGLYRRLYRHVSK